MGTSPPSPRCGASCSRARFRRLRRAGSTTKELAPLRAVVPDGAHQGARASIKAAYAADLGKGLFFVARGRDVAMKPGAQAISKLESVPGGVSGRCHVEALSPADRQRRARVRVFAVARQQGAVVSRRRRHRRTVQRHPPVRGRDAGVIDLATLETVGPLRLGAPGTKVGAVVLAWSKDGDPVWITRAGPEPGEDETSYALDATRSAAVVVGLSGAVPGNRTTATPWSVTTSDVVADMVTVAIMARACKSSTRIGRCARRARWIPRRCAGHLRASGSCTQARSTSARPPHPATSPTGTTLPVGARQEVGGAR